MLVALHSSVSPSSLNFTGLFLVSPNVRSRVIVDRFAHQTRTIGFTLVSSSL